jgi:hypothetical protein
VDVVWAPRIWCFFVMLCLRHNEDFSRALWDKGFRFVMLCLRHNEDFSRALWDKGFRFVGCDFDPTDAAPEKEAWTPSTGFWIVSTTAGKDSNNSLRCWCHSTDRDRH